MKSIMSIVGGASAGKKKPAGGNGSTRDYVRRTSVQKLRQAFKDDDDDAAMDALDDFHGAGGDED